MKIGQRLISLLLCGAMLVSLFPQMALAIDIGTDIPGLGIDSVPGSELKGNLYYLIQDGSAVTEGASEASYNFYYDSASATLTLKDAVLAKTLYVPYGTKVVLVGTNTIGEEGNTSSSGIQVGSGTGDTAVTVTGEGSLTVYCLNEGIYSEKGDIVIEGGIISITNTQSSPICSRYGGIKIGGDAEITAISENSPISSKTDLVICGNAKVTVGGKVVTGIESSGKIIISDAAAVEVTSSNIAITGGDGIDILDDAYVVATGSTALNSFGGSIKIEGTAKATATGASQAAVSVGQGGNSTGTVTITGSLEASGFVGIGVNGTGDILIDEGKVAVDAVLVGIYPSGGGNVEIRNHAEASATVTGAYGIYSNGGSINISNSTVEASTSGEQYAALGNVPVLTYDNSCKVYAGNSIDDAKLIAGSERTDATYQSNYIKIEPTLSYSVAVTGGSASVKQAAEGDTVTITAVIPDGQQFLNWTSDDVAFTDASASTTTFVMPAGDVTVTAVFQAIYGINTEKDGQGTVTVSPDDAAEGTTVKVTAEPEEGYRFVEWKGTTVSDGETMDIIFDDPTLPETTFTMPDGAVTITAVFEKVAPDAPEQAVTGLSDEAAMLLGVGIVATGAAAAAAYYYRDVLPVWKLDGVVKLPDGTPASNAAIELWRDGALVKTLTTDENGAFAARVPKGAYEAAVTWEQGGVVCTIRREVEAEGVLRIDTVQEIVLQEEEG